MDKIVDINKRIELKKQKTQLTQYRDKIRALQKIVQCSSCQFKCAMCDHHLQENDISHDCQTAQGLVLCDSCRGEYEDFLAMSNGEKPDDIFWHNEAWLKMWSAWLGYRRAINDFMNSPEFKLLLEEMDH
jgi:hypothetical protein